MAGSDERNGFLKRLFARGKPQPESDPEEPEWLRSVREANQRNYPKIDFRGMSNQEMDEAIRSHSQSIEDSLIEWLGRAGPMEWHCAALTWNWDDGLEPLRWIIAQPNCDAGTVIHLFAIAEPAYWSRYESVDAIEADSPYMMDSVRFMIEICERWAAGQYKEYQFRPEYLPGVSPDSHPWPVPESLANAKMRGEAVDTRGWDQGYPEEVLRAW
ncbi:MAG: DUF4274 domain-containing protein [Allosphingosinicella sp.]